eukprot:TRINITY_DN54440_c0_g1_i1.p2 TRINITY_DN54440_c0_g1~~TRINITY_DN54440_c0_g1_i1.p2  ORF type:complete len:118 (+),score=18.67 TRINITY_DN54440_c0_g1_i1:62-415(+)
MASHAGNKAAVLFLEAALQGNARDCKAILQSEPHVLEACDRSGRTALILASMSGHMEVCRFLCETRADVEATDCQGKTSLSYAAARNHSEVARLLLDYGAEIEATDCIVRDMGCVTV